MWFRMLELLYAPFVLIFFSYNSTNNSLIYHRGTAVENAKPEVNVSQCTNSGKLFYDHPNPAIRGCYQENDSSPCGENMKLYRIDGTNNGECDCDRLPPRVQIYHKETNRCYPIYTQAYCETGEQLVITKEDPSRPFCQRTVCYEKLINPEHKGKDLVPIKNNVRCVEIGKDCLSAREGESVWRHYKITPVCAFGRSIHPPSIPLSCRPGTYRAMSGHCQPPNNWEWD